MASFAIDLSIGTVVTFLSKELSSTKGVCIQLDETKLELVAIKSFLEEVAEGNKALTELEKTWVICFRELGYDVEDVIDDFLYYTNEKQSRKNQFTRLVYIPKHLWHNHQIVVKLENIIARLQNIPDRMKRYGVESIRGKNNPNKDLKDASLFLKDDKELVGIEQDKQMLMEWLFDGKQHLTAMSLVGMGGSGKTTLAAQIYNDETNVRRKFDCYAWITVSQTYVVNELIKCLLKELYQSRKEKVAATKLDVMNLRELIEMVVKYLEGKNYLVIVDDVWDVNLWNNMIKVTLPDINGFSSRIIFTTRKEDVASSWRVEKNVHHIEPLHDGNDWKLFSMNAFYNCPGNCCPEDLEPIASKLVEKCQGLPLALAALGGLMYTMSSKSDWIRVCENLNWQLNENPMLQNAKNVLLLSFNEMSYPLKRCFLYCCAFPEDYLIDRGRLTRLWIADGLVEPVKGVIMEDLAVYYLMELISRNMIQVVQFGRHQRQKPCKLHDLMREIALSISDEEKFLAVYDGISSSGTELDLQQCRVRRLSIHRSDTEIEVFPGMSQLRSFLVFGINIKLSVQSLKLFLSRSKLLRVLDVENMPIDKLPKEVWNLFNLRSLNLRRTSIMELPKSIGRLCSLESLDIRNTKIETLPKEIAELSKLRHLLMNRYPSGNEDIYKTFAGMKATPKISKLKNLQDLDCIESSGDFIKQVGKMTQLTRIGIANIRGIDGIDLCVSIQNLKLLKYITLVATNEDENLDIDAMLSSPPPDLHFLILYGKLQNVPQWFSWLQSLESLLLHWSRLTEDVLPHIATLPNLTHVSLINSYVGECLYFQQGFLKLKNFTLKSSHNLKQIIFTQGVMPALQVLSLSNLIELKMPPNGIQHLSDLQELSLRFVPTELIHSIRRGGMYYHLVQHIPDIDHYYQTPFGISHERLH